MSYIVGATLMLTIVAAALLLARTMGNHIERHFGGDRDTL